MMEREACLGAGQDLHDPKPLGEPEVTGILTS